MRIQFLPGNQVGFYQLLITRQIATRIGQRGLIFRQLSLRLCQGDLKLAGIDLCQQVARADLLPFLKVQGDELAVPRGLRTVTVLAAVTVPSPFR
ncbi:Uncharacterised protein [Salmonella bongori]|nr:Uncharacterised protein [Salmonella bongori]